MLVINASSHRPPTQETLCGLTEYSQLGSEGCVLGACRLGPKLRIRVVLAKLRGLAFSFAADISNENRLGFWVLCCVEVGISRISDVGPDGKHGVHLQMATKRSCRQISLGSYLGMCHGGVGWFGLRLGSQILAHPRIEGGRWAEQCGESERGPGRSRGGRRKKGGKCRLALSQAGAKLAEARGRIR